MEIGGKEASYGPWYHITITTLIVLHTRLAEVSLQPPPVLSVASVSVFVLYLVHNTTGHP